MKVSSVVSAAVRAARAEGFKRHGRGDWRYGPGRFEGTDWTVAYWYQRYMDGDGEYLADSNHAFELDAAERAAFGAKSDPCYAVLCFSDSGFIDLVYLNARDYSRLVHHIESHGEEDSQS